MEQVPHIAAFAHENSHQLGNLIQQYLVPMIIKYLTDINNQVRKTSQTSLLLMIEQGLINEVALEEKICPLVLQLLEPNNMDDYRTEAVTLMGKLALLVGKDVTERLFLKRFAALCLDTSFHVRKVCAASFGDFCAIVEKEATEQELLPKFFSLCDDSVWGVRKACAEVFMPVSCVCSMETRHKELAPVYMNLLCDQSRWVRMAAFQALGPFISTFADPEKTGLQYNKMGFLLVSDVPNSVESEQYHEFGSCNNSDADESDISCKSCDTAVPPPSNDFSDCPQSTKCRSENSNSSYLTVIEVSSRTLDQSLSSNVKVSKNDSKYSNCDTSSLLTNHNSDSDAECDANSSPCESQDDHSTSSVQQQSDPVSCAEEEAAESERFWGERTFLGEENAQTSNNSVELEKPIGWFESSSHWKVKPSCNKKDCPVDDQFTLEESAESDQHHNEFCTTHTPHCEPTLKFAVEFQSMEFSSALKRDISDCDQEQSEDGKLTDLYDKLRQLVSKRRVQKEGSCSSALCIDENSSGPSCDVDSSNLNSESHLSSDSSSSKLDFIESSEPASAVVDSTSCPAEDCESAFNHFQFWRMPLPEVEIKDEELSNQSSPDAVRLMLSISQFFTPSERRKHVALDEFKTSSVSNCTEARHSSTSPSSIFESRTMDEARRRRLDYNDEKEKLLNYMPANEIGTDCQNQVQTFTRQYKHYHQKSVAEREPPPTTQNVLLAHDQDIVPPELLLRYLSMTDASRAQSVDAEIARHCAYSLPAVALTLGRRFWPCLKETYNTLASDMQGFIMQWKVRRTLASSMHKLAMILGPDIAAQDLLPIFSGFIRDLDEVRIGILQHLSEFLCVLRPKERKDYLPRLREFLSTDNDRNWRFRLILAEQLIDVASLYDPPDVREYLVPLSLALVKDKVSEVRLTAVRVMAVMMRQMSQNPTPALTKEVLAELAEQFIHAPKWLHRQLYVYLCQEFIKENSLPPDQFAEDAMPHLLYLCWDRVANVRLAIARCLAMVIWPKATFSDPNSPHCELILQAIHTLQSDVDADVRYFANMVATHECSCLQHSMLTDLEEPPV